MGLIENARLALEGLKSNKMRTLLTMLGIIIGISSVITIWTLGDALTNSVTDGFSTFGTNQISLQVEPKDGNDWGLVREESLIKEEYINAFNERFGGDIVGYSISLSSLAGEIKENKKSAKVTVMPTTEGTFFTDNLTLVAGRFLEEKDMTAVRSVCVISDKALKSFYSGDYSDILGKELEIKVDRWGLVNLVVVGVYKYEPISFGVMGGMDGERTTLYMPITTGDREFSGGREIEYGFWYFGAKLKDGVNVATKSKEIEDFFNNSFYKEQEDVQIKVETLESAISQVNSVLGTVKIGVGAIAAISLLVGGIGVMNILLVSVTERTREIGIRKALGATNGDIRYQFITESVIICIIGGAIGVFLGGVFGYLGSQLLKFPTIPSIESVMVAVGFSMIIGIFFGYYPANKAAKLNPIDALRYE